MLKIFDMTVATTGVNERTAKAAGLDYDKVYTYSDSPMPPIIRAARHVHQDPL